MAMTCLSFPQHGRNGEAAVFHLDVPTHAYDLILARPENHSVTLSALAYQDLEGLVIFGTQSGQYPRSTPLRSFKAGQPTNVVLGALDGDARYFYRFRFRSPSAGTFEDSPEGSFHTKRKPGSAFTFTLTADAHLDEHTSADVYNQALSNIRDENPDFNIDLGNLFMTDKHATRDEAARQYLAQR
ncbi:MAG TPA: hypothetical protein VMI31_13005, partial [Fimbriimonadaceae bacterium]|nr:hypothetical protein [Fimbriimonadaceae bacterium]